MWCSLLRRLPGRNPANRNAGLEDAEVVVSRQGRATVDMANGPQQRVQPFPDTITLLESLGAINNHNCVSC